MGAIRVEVRSGLAVLTLDRADKRNALSTAMWRDLAEACADLEDRPEVRVLVVQGAGRHFSGGADIGSLGTEDPAVFAAANEAADRALRDFSRPTVAVIRGACIGGGCQIASACHLRLADDTAVFGVTPARLGLVYPGEALARLVRCVGAAAARHLLLTAEIVDAARALRIGLVDEVQPAAALAARRDELVGSLLQGSLLTQMASLEMIAAAERQGTVPADLEEWWRRRAEAPDGDRREGVEAFLEGRGPAFRWRPGESPQR